MTNPIGVRSVAKTRRSPGHPTPALRQRVNKPGGDVVSYIRTTHAAAG
jgi:hypothetical protein